MTIRRFRKTTSTRLLACTLIGGCASAAASGTVLVDPPPPSSAATSTVLLFGHAHRPQPSSLAELLQGRIAGLRVERVAGGGVTLRLRAPGSMYGDEPLVVLDGSPLPGGAMLSDLLLSIDPADVVRVDVLRDVAASAIYGPRGTNGVVLITLRHAKR